MLLWTLCAFAYFWFQGLIKLVSSNVILHWDTVKKDSLAVSQISASFVCGRGHCGVFSNLLSCHLLCLPPPRLPLILPARVEPVSRSACDHGAVPRLSGQAANDIMFYCGCVCLWGGEAESDTSGHCDTLSVLPTKFTLWVRSNCGYERGWAGNPTFCGFYLCSPL